MIALSPGAPRGIITLQRASRGAPVHSSVIGRITTRRDRLVHNGATKTSRARIVVFTRYLTKTKHTTTGKYTLFDSRVYEEYFVLCISNQFRRLLYSHAYFAVLLVS